MRAGVLVGLGLLAAFGVPAVARACSCAGRATVAQAIAGADVVFEGRVRSTAFVAYEGQRTRLAVERAHKGELPATVDVSAAKVCSLAFAPGVSWLVYAQRDADGTLSTSMCSRSAALVDAHEDLAWLGNARRALGVVEVVAREAVAIEPHTRGATAVRTAVGVSIAACQPSAILQWVAAIVADVGLRR